MRSRRNFFFLLMCVISIQNMASNICHEGQTKLRDFFNMRLWVDFICIRVIILMISEHMVENSMFTVFMEMVTFNWLQLNSKRDMQITLLVVGF